ncbi:PPOX class F420-dependent oxidoreductase [Streptomyces sp. NPDC059176]|uniref:PPOX class F420-dependent oxidoreductase n=1 Tax=Streptomyces sp. NPDC059176 TaxID=3346758 RepID=UPI0036B44951
MAKQMSQEEWRAFVSEGTRTGKLSTVHADGSPHVTPVWFVLDGDDVVFTTAKHGVKDRNLARDERAAMCVDHDHPPYSFVLVRGRVELSEDPAGLRDWATRIAARYMGEDRAEEYGRRNGVPGELLVRIRIDQVVAEAGVSN